MKGKFVAPTLFQEMHRTRLLKNQLPSTIGVALYDWYKDLPNKARKTRRTFYAQIAFLNHMFQEKAMVDGRPFTPVTLDNRKRRRWLKAWSLRYNVTFRKINKKFKLSREERTTQGFFHAWAWVFGKRVECSVMVLTFLEYF